MGSSDKIYGSKVPKRVKASEANGQNINPGPYEAVVKNAKDSTRAGRLQVWIPDMGAGDQDDPQNWYTVSYASPFAGTSYQPEGYDATALNNWLFVQHTYGFWAVPPDIGNTVLVIFINGDPQRGYWFACTVNKLGVNMIPAIAGGNRSKMDTGILGNGLDKALTDESFWPLTETNENDGENVSSDFLEKKKPVHEYQTLRYIQQGLDRDQMRGAQTSSVQRNITSAVFGISTPGRPAIGDTGDNKALQDKVNNSDIEDSDIPLGLGRKGGHSFVMDDGDFFGKSKLLRLRTTDGHQILMDDTNGMTYIINSEGTCWIELAKSGQLHIFSSGGLNMRSQGDINIHSDQKINMHAEDEINMYAGNKFDINTKVFNQTSADLTKIYASTVQIGGSSDVNISASSTGSFKAGGTLIFSGGPIHLNTSPAPVVSKPAPITKYLHSDTTYNPGTLLWEIQPGKLNTIVAVAPTHEPWERVLGANESDSVSGAL
jgi:hypothetical protein